MAPTMTVMQEDEYYKMLENNPQDFDEPVNLSKTIKARTVSKSACVTMGKTGCFRIKFKGSILSIDCVLMRGGATGAAWAMMGNEYFWNKGGVLNFHEKTFSVMEPLGKGSDPIIGIPMQKRVPLGMDSKAAVSKGTRYLEHVTLSDGVLKEEKREKLSKLQKDEMMKSCDFTFRK